MTEQHFDIIIVGAGIAGVGAACHLATEHPNKSLALLERRERMGGTWDLFRYPGIRSDIDMLTLGYQFRPWRSPDVVAEGHKIRQYVAETAAEYGIDKKVHYGLKIVSANWSSARRRWTVRALHEATGEMHDYSCGFLAICTGYYNYDAGYLPDFAGMDRFAGQCVHTQHWPDDLDYRGKKVVVIGSGATAVTVVPAMAEKAEHVTMLQRSPSYVTSLPAFDKISEFLDRFLSAERVYALARKRNIVIQRKLYFVGQRWPKLLRRLLLGQARRRLGASFDMRHFTPTYMPFEQRLCVALDGDLFKVLSSGRASVVTDEIETFTERGIRLKSGRELDADIIVTATGLNLQVGGGMQLAVDGQPVGLQERMLYKSILVEDIPNLSWFFGYTAAAYTLKADIAAAYLCRLLRHMDDHGFTVARPHDRENCATTDCIISDLQSGYIERGKDLMPRQGAKLPWKTLMHYEKDCRLLLEDPIDDGVLTFDRAPLKVAV